MIGGASGRLADAGLRLLSVARFVFLNLEMVDI